MTGAVTPHIELDGQQVLDVGGFDWCAWCSSLTFCAYHAADPAIRRRHTTPQNMDQARRQRDRAESERRRLLELSHNTYANRSTT